MSKYGIVVLGNGYDLFHDNKTSYIDFVNDRKDKLSDNMWMIYFENKLEAKGWIDLENEIKKILQDYENLKQEYIELNINQPIPIIYKKLLLFLTFTVRINQEKYQYEVEFNNQRRLRNKYRNNYSYLNLVECKYEFWDSEGYIDYDCVQKKMIDDFIEVKEELKEYIKENIEINDNYTKENSIYKNLNQYDKLLVLNFNYTNTLDFYNTNIENIFLHGSVDTEIIFGHNNIDNSDFAIFNKLVQEQIYKKNYKFELLEKIIEFPKMENEEWEFLILGHSFDENDHGMISWIYEELYNNEEIYFNKIKYFYYENQHNIDRITRIYNIRKFFNNSMGSIKSYSGSKSTNGKDYLEYLEKRDLIESILLEK